MTYGTKAHKNDDIARRHANAFLKALHFGEWNAVYLAKRRELEGDPRWIPNKSATRSATVNAQHAERVADTADSFLYWIKLAQEPITTKQLCEVMGVARVTALRYLGDLERAGKVVRYREQEWPSRTLWSVVDL